MNKMNDDASININNDKLSVQQRTTCNHDSISSGIQSPAANIVFGDSFEDKGVVAADQDVVVNDYDDVIDDDDNVALIEDKGGCTA